MDIDKDDSKIKIRDLLSLTVYLLSKIIQMYTDLQESKVFISKMEDGKFKFKLKHRLKLMLSYLLIFQPLVKTKLWQGERIHLKYENLDTQHNL